MYCTFTYELMVNTRLMYRTFIYEFIVNARHIVHLPMNL